MDSLPMRSKSLQLGNDVEVMTTFPRKRTKLNAMNGRDRTKTRKKKLSSAQDFARRNLSKFLFVILGFSDSVGWGCRIHRLFPLQRGKTPPASVLFMALNILMVRLK